MVFQSCCSKLLCKVAPKSCSPKRFPAAASQNYSQNTTAKRLPQSGYASNLFPKAAPQRYSPKRLPKVAPQSYYRKLTPKVPQSCGFSKQSNCSSMLLQSRKIAPHSCSPKIISKVATESRVPKKLSKPVRTGCYRKSRPKKALQTSAYRLSKQAQSIRWKTSTTSETSRRGMLNKAQKQ